MGGRVFRHMIYVGFVDRVRGGIGIHEMLKGGVFKGEGFMIQFPREMDENWVRYGLAKLGQISRLPNWQKIVVLCVHNTTSALNS